MSTRKAVLFSISLSFFISGMPSFAAAQDAGALMGGIAGGMIGGMIAGSMARQNQGGYYRRPPREYRSYQRTHVARARAPAHVQGGSAATINTASDPFAKPQPAATTTVSSH